MKKTKTRRKFPKKKERDKKLGGNKFRFLMQNKPPSEFFSEIDFHYIEIPNPKDNKPEFRKSITISRTDGEINSA